MHFVRSSPSVHPITIELHYLSHRIYVNQFYVEGSAKIDNESVDCVVEIRKQGKNIYMLLIKRVRVIIVTRVHVLIWR